MSAEMRKKNTKILVQQTHREERQHRPQNWAAYFPYPNPLVHFPYQAHHWRRHAIASGQPFWGALVLGYDPSHRRDEHFRRLLVRTCVSEVLGRTGGYVGKMLLGRMTTMGTTLRDQSRNRVVTGSD